MEVQVLHRTSAGDFKQQAVLSFVYKRIPGEMRTVFNRIKYMDLPNPANNIAADIMLEDLHVLDFVFDSREAINNNESFGYYRYVGSMTQPPCAENVLWVIASDVIPLSSTIITMFRDALVDPKVLSSDNFNILGNNRILDERKTQF